MATPTEAEINAQLQNAVDLLEDSRAFAIDNTPNLIDLIDTVTQGAEGDFAREMIAGAEGFRDSFAGAFANGSFMLEAVIRTYGKFIDEPSNEVSEIIKALRKWFTDNSKNIKERNFTFGPPSLSGTGSGTLERLNIDENGDDIENQTPDAKYVTIVSDANSGAERNSEAAEIGGGYGGRDILNIEGVGQVGTMQATSRDDSILENSSFDLGPSNGNLTSPDDISGWESLDTSNVAVTVNSTNFNYVTTAFRPKANDDETIYSLWLKAANHRLRQKLVNRGIQLDPDSAYYSQVAWYRDGSTYTGAGTLTLRCGSQSASVVVAAQTGWNVLKFGGSTNNWFKNFNEDDMSIRVDWVRSGGNGILIDDVDFVPYQVFDGGYYRLMAGATAFLEGDEFTWTDSAVESKIQRWLWILFREYLPSASTPTLADP